MWYPLDLRDLGSLDTVMAVVRPQLVVNASSGSADWATTAEGPIRLAMVAARYGTRMVHVSSDAVFSGTRVHYDESSLPDPASSCIASAPRQPPPRPPPRSLASSGRHCSRFPPVLSRVRVTSFARNRRREIIKR
ncbi:sugar nucleotide-binding protein [Streptomyces sp. NPDC060209]|uniref:sugar nucleotide-binding protein n=1 Tax=Streptomyces sp. NPDC060209 TaxID=3347073 RepID=UPI003665F37D